jgi:hypothetical protein
MLVIVLHIAISRIFWSNLVTSLRARAEQSQHIVTGSQSLGINLSTILIKQIATRFDGMMLLERFLEEQTHAS